MKASKLFPAIVACVLLAACGTDSTGSDDVTKIGVIMSSTGAASGMGVPERQGVELYDRLHAESENLEFIYADDKSDPGVAVAELNRMVIEDQIDAVICCTTTPASLAIREAIEQHGVLQMSVAAGAEIVEPPSERPLSFKTPYTDRAVQVAAVEDMKTNGVESVAVLHLDDSYGESGRDALYEAAEDAGIEVVATAAYGRDSTDVTAQALSLRAASPDAYVVWGILPSANVAQSALFNIGVTEPTYHSFGVTTPSFMELGGESVEGVRIAAGRLVAHGDVEAEDEESEAIRNFADAFRAEFSEEVTALSGFAYDAAGVLSAAAKEAGHTSGEEFRVALEGITDYVGVTGTFTYSPEDHSGIDHGSLSIIEVRDGEYVQAGGN